MMFRARQFGLLIAWGVLTLTLAPAAADTPSSAAPAAVTAPAPTPALESQPAALDSADTQPSAEDTVVNFLKENEPALYKSAMVLREKDEARFHHWMQAMSPEVTDLMALQKSDSERFDLTMQDRRLAFRALQLSKQLGDLQKKHDARREQIDDISAKLLETVTEQFDLQQKLHQRELEAQTRRLEQLQHQLDQLHSELDNRAKNRQELINQRIAELMKNPHSWLKW